MGAFSGSTCLTSGNRGGILCLGASSAQNRGCAETRQESRFLLRLCFKPKRMSFQPIFYNTKLKPVGLLNIFQDPENFLKQQFLLSAWISRNILDPNRDLQRFILREF